MFVRLSAVACLLFAVVIFFVFRTDALAMTSTNYGLLWDSINSGGEDTSTSTNFKLRDTVGEQATGESASTNYALRAGYRVGDEVFPSLAFAIHTQENATQVAFSDFSFIGKTVTVASTLGYATGNFIGVIENEGLSEIVAIGKIITILGNIITVDAWDGSPGSISPTPVGGDDFVYRLEGNSAQLGTLDASLGKTSLTATDVSSNALNGYSVSVSDDGNLRYATSTYILNVADGAVSVGSEEYGWHVFGVSATNTSSDHPFATTTSMIQRSSSTASNDRVGLVYKAAIAPSTAAGSYSHTVYFSVTANY